MATQIGTLKVQGTVDNVTFAQTQDGYIAKKKAYYSRRRVKTSSKYSRVREINAEFKTAAQAGRLLRDSVEGLLKDATDGKVASRLLQQMLRALHEDMTSSHGSRTISGGKPALLERFDFNIKSNVRSILATPYTATIERVTGKLSIDIPAFIPAQTVAAPGGTTHFKIVSAGVELNFDEESFVKDENDSGLLPYENTSTGVISLSNSVTPASTNPLFLMLGVRFYAETNGEQNPLKDSLYNGLTIVKVNAV
jgi:hypothetical protein